MIEYYNQIQILKNNYIHLFVEIVNNIRNNDRYTEGYNY